MLLELLDPQGCESQPRPPRRRRRASQRLARWAGPVGALARRMHANVLALAATAAAVLLPLYALSLPLYALLSDGQNHVTLATRMTGLCLLPELRRLRPGRIVLILAAGMAVAHSAVPDPAAVIVAFTAVRAIAGRACMRIRPSVPAAAASASGVYPGRVLRMHPPADTDADTAPAASAVGCIRVSAEPATAPGTATTSGRMQPPSFRPVSRRQ